MARTLHADACRDHAQVAWFVLWDLPAYPGRYAARLGTSGPQPSSYLLQADSMAEIQTMLSPGLVRFGREGKKLRKNLFGNKLQHVSVS